MSQQEIYDVLKKGGRWSANEICKQLPNLTGSSIYNGLRALRNSKLVKFNPVLFKKGNKTQSYLEYWIEDDEENEQEVQRIDGDHYMEIHNKKGFTDLAWGFHIFCQRFVKSLDKIKRETIHYKRMKDLFKRNYSKEIELKPYYDQDLEKVSKKLSKLLKTIGEE